MRFDIPLQFSGGVAWHPTGLRIAVVKAPNDPGRVLTISDLNPEKSVVHLMTRWDCFRLGLLIARRSIWAREPEP